MLACIISTAQGQMVTPTLQHLQSMALPDPGSCDQEASWWPPANGEEGAAHLTRAQTPKSSFPESRSLPLPVSQDSTPGSLPSRFYKAVLQGCETGSDLVPCNDYVSLPLDTEGRNHRQFLELSRNTAITSHSSVWHFLNSVYNVTDNPLPQHSVTYIKTWSVMMVIFYVSALKNNLLIFCLRRKK